AQDPESAPRHLMRAFQDRATALVAEQGGLAVTELVRAFAEDDLGRPLRVDDALAVIGFDDDAHRLAVGAERDLVHHGRPALARRVAEARLARDDDQRALGGVAHDAPLFAL